MTLAKFNPKNRNFIRNIPEIFNRHPLLAISLCTVYAKEAFRQTTDENVPYCISIIKEGVLGIARPFGIASSIMTTLIAIILSAKFDINIHVLQLPCIAKILCIKND